MREPRKGADTRGIMGLREVFFVYLGIGGSRAYLYVGGNNPMKRKMMIQKGGGRDKNLSE